MQLIHPIVSPDIKPTSSHVSGTFLEHPSLADLKKQEIIRIFVI